MTSLFTSQTPATTNNSDGAPGIGVAVTLLFSTAGQVTGVRFWATDTVSGTYTGFCYEVTTADPGGAGTLLASKVRGAAPTPSTWNDIVFDTPVTITPNTKLYRVGVHNSAGRYVATTNFAPFIGGAGGLTNGPIKAPHNGDDAVGLGTTYQGSFIINAASGYPTSPGNASNYFADVLFTAGGASMTTVTSTLEARWRVSNRVTSTLESRWRVANIVTSTLDVRWRVYNRLISTLEARWRVYNKVPDSVLEARWRVYKSVVTTLEAQWRVANRVLSFLTGQWRVTPDVAPPVISSGYLTTQRALTLWFIQDDPTTLQLVPVSRVTTPSGGFTEVDGEPRAPQTVKMILLAYDQRPTLTVAGVERIIDYHMLGRWDMEAAVGDYWIDEEGTRWDIVGFSEGWDYETKAFASRHVPRPARP